MEDHVRGGVDEDVFRDADVEGETLPYRHGAADDELGCIGTELLEIAVPEKRGMGIRLDLQGKPG